MSGVISMQAYFFSNPGLQVGIHPAAVGTAPRAFAPGRISVGCPHCLRRFYHARTVTGQESHYPHWRSSPHQEPPGTGRLLFSLPARSRSWRNSFPGFCSSRCQWDRAGWTDIHFSRFREGLALSILYCTLFFAFDKGT